MKLPSVRMTLTNEGTKHECTGLDRFRRKDLCSKQPSCEVPLGPEVCCYRLEFLSRASGKGRKPTLIPFREITEDRDEAELRFWMMLTHLLQIWVGWGTAPTQLFSEKSSHDAECSDLDALLTVSVMVNSCSFSFVNQCFFLLFLWIARR